MPRASPSGPVASCLMSLYPLRSFWRRRSRASGRRMDRDVYAQTCGKRSFVAGLLMSLKSAALSDDFSMSIEAVSMSIQEFQSPAVEMRALS